MSIMSTANQWRIYLIIKNIIGSIMIIRFLLTTMAGTSSTIASSTIYFTY